MDWKRMSWRRSIVWAVVVVTGFVALDAIVDRHRPDRDDLVQAVFVLVVLLVITLVERIVLALVDRRRAAQAGREAGPRIDAATATGPEASGPRAMPQAADRRIEPRRGP